VENCSLHRSKKFCDVYWLTKLQSLEILYICLWERRVQADYKTKKEREPPSISFSLLHDRFRRQSSTLRRVLCWRQQRHSVLDMTPRPYCRTEGNLFLFHTYGSQLRGTDSLYKFGEATEPTIGSGQLVLRNRIVYVLWSGESALLGRGWLDLWNRRKSQEKWCSRTHGYFRDFWRDLRGCLLWFLENITTLA